MKKDSLRKLLYLSSMLLIALMVMVSCDKDDDDNGEPPVLVEDGFYIKGDGTALTDFDLKGLMKSTKNEVTQEPRASLLEIFVAVKGGSDGFNIVRVAGTEHTTHGPGADFGLVPEEDRDGEEPRTADFWRGSVAVTDTKFTVPDDGLYHVVLDTELGKVVVARVKWGMIGAATPGGWGEDTELTAAFDLNKMEFKKEEVILFEDPYKFRYSNGWKIFIDNDGDVKINSNLGGSLSNLEPGGADIMHDDYGVFTAELTWELGEPITASLTRTGDGPELPDFPDKMYLVGDATAYGWATPGENEDAVMHKLAGGTDNDGIFWKILHLEANEGFKISAENWGSPNLDYGDVDEWDADGFEVIADDNNWTVANSGMYMVVLNLQDDQVRVSLREVAVYGIGNAFGGFESGIEANKFTVDDEAKTVTSPALPADGDIRMYAAHPWIPDWWHAEFNLYEGTIEYRGAGGDQPAVPGTAGQVITLMFDDNTGTIQ